MQYKVIKTLWHRKERYAPDAFIKLNSQQASLLLRQGKIAEHEPAAPAKQRRRRTKNK